MDKKINPIATMLVLVTACLLLNVLWHWKIPLYFGFVFGLTGILSPRLSRLVSRGWMWLAGWFGKLSNSVLLTMVYFLVVAPVGMIRRMLGRDGMTRFDKAAGSNFTERDHQFQKEDLEKTW